VIGEVGSNSWFTSAREERCLRAAARAHLHPDLVVVVAVGERSVIEPDLKRLNLGVAELREK